ncbi:hypothetical protein [Streptomyces sp. NBC_00690]|uniref:hypothetical protein n=1 Tax=Streptomyces sp. NBC_00690 TaxID=2975808 RepID=UPI002E27FDEF|nr:hypothetical protein [Streptomyces sp. NBC_00690]
MVKGSSTAQNQRKARTVFGELLGSARPATKSAERGIGGTEADQPSSVIETVLMSCGQAESRDRPFPEEDRSSLCALPGSTITRGH